MTGYGASMREDVINGMMTRARVILVCFCQFDRTREMTDGRLDHGKAE